MAALNKTAICNLALGHLSKSVITGDVDTEQSTAARRCKEWYDPARRQALVDFDWAFARLRQTLATHSDDPPDQWAYRYEYPTTCIAPRHLENPAGPQADPVPYSLELSCDATQQTILTDLDEAVLVFTTDQESVPLFSPHFAITMSYLIAFYIAEPLTGSTKIRDKMMASYQQAVLLAGIHDKNTTETPAPQRDASHIRFRTS